MTFSDNAASFAAIKELTEQRAALVAQRDELQERFDAHTRACQVGIRQMPAAYSHVSSRLTLSAFMRWLD